MPSPLAETARIARPSLAVRAARTRGTRGRRSSAGAASPGSRPSPRPPAASSGPPPVRASSIMCRTRSCIGSKSRTTRRTSWRIALESRAAGPRASRVGERAIELEVHHRLAVRGIAPGHHALQPPSSPRAVPITGCRSRRTRARAPPAPRSPSRRGTASRRCWSRRSGAVGGRSRRARASGSIHHGRGVGAARVREGEQRARDEPRAARSPDCLELVGRPSRRRNAFANAGGRRAARARRLAAGVRGPCRGRLEDGDGRRLRRRGRSSGPDTLIVPVVGGSVPSCQAGGRMRMPRGGRS